MERHDSRRSAWSADSMPVRNPRVRLHSRGCIALWTCRRRTARGRASGAGRSLWLDLTSAFFRLPSAFRGGRARPVVGLRSGWCRIWLLVALLRRPNRGREQETANCNACRPHDHRQDTRLWLAVRSARVNLRNQLRFREVQWAGWRTGMQWLAEAITPSADRPSASDLSTHHEVKKPVHVLFLSK